MVGTVNFTAFPAPSAALASLCHSSVPRFVASYARKTAGPQLVAWPVQYVFVLSAHTIPLVVPLAEREGVAPGKLYVSPEWEPAGVVNFPVVGLNVNACSVVVPKAPAM